MEEIIEVALRVAQGNPGAITVIKRLEWYSKWHEMLRLLDKHGPRGGELWELYKDVHHQDIDRVARDLEDRMAKDKEFKHFREQENALIGSLVPFIDNGTVHLTIPTPKKWKCKRKGCKVDFIHQHTTYGKLKKS